MTSLKDFPQWNPYASETDKRAYVSRVFEWKENFEKELREICSKSHNGSMWTSACARFIEEKVLGE